LELFGNFLNCVKFDAEDNYHNEFLIVRGKEKKKEGAMEVELQKTAALIAKDLALALFSFEKEPNVEKLIDYFSYCYSQVLNLLSEEDTP